MRGHAFGTLDVRGRADRPISRPYTDDAVEPGELLAFFSDWLANEAGRRAMNPR